MGNCMFKPPTSVQIDDMVKIVTTNGGIMELYAPITAETITHEFPGHAIYRSNEVSSPPLLRNEELQGGHFYYLLPLNNTSGVSSPAKLGPYRMSLDTQRLAKRTAEVLPRYNSSGVWKVKLVINPEQLAEIMAEGARTEELIESVRTVAKCGSGNVLSASSLCSSDQWSVCSSSWKGSV
ncbi:hypothetical protein M5689_004589 [Euphorbia peplus]|nr:hypothetical protein M5689_004589 [Euphorbia peplus]